MTAPTARTDNPFPDKPCYVCETKGPTACRVCGDRCAHQIRVVGDREVRMHREPCARLFSDIVHIGLYGTDFQA